MDILDKISVNEQNSIRIGSDKVIYFDPFKIKDALHDADIVFITHDHYDHFSPEDISKVSNDRTLFVFPDSMAKSVRTSGIALDKVTYVKPLETLTLLDINIDTVPAFNIIKPFHPKASGWVGYVVTVDGAKVYVCGDTDDIPEARKVQCDVICVPIGGTFTMDAKSAAVFTKAVMPRYAIPTHYGTAVGKPSDADDFENYLGGEVECIRKIVF